MTDVLPPEEETPAAPEGGAVLILATPLSKAARALCLASGDRLVAVDGAAPPDRAQILHERMRTHRGAATLTFRRGETQFSVLTQTSDLGFWRTGTGTAPATGVRTEALVNWEIWRSRDGTADIFRTDPHALATLLPLPWLLFMRLWRPAAALAVALAMLAMFGTLAFVAGWVLTGLFVHRAGTALLRSDRAAMGMERVAVIAARSETAAMRTALQLHPGLSYRFAGPAGGTADEDTAAA